MIRRSTLVDQLYKDRRRHRNCQLLTLFSPKPFPTSWLDVVVAVFLALIFSALFVSSLLTLCYGYLSLFIVIICVGVFLLVRLKIARKRFLKKKERRMLLPLSM